MNYSIPCALIIVVGCIVAAGCVARTDSVNEPVVSAPTFVPFSTPSTTTVLDGILRVSVNYPKTLAVVVDNETLGTVNTSTPLFLKIPEGNHTVRVCVGWQCEQQNITTVFGKQVTVDFSERLQKNVEFPDPTARILHSYKQGDIISVEVEYLNPDTQDHTISMNLIVGYEYSDDRSHVKLGDSAQTSTSLFVKAGTRETQTIDLSLSHSGPIVNFGAPHLEDIKIQ